MCLKIECNGRIRWTDDDGKALVKYFNYQDGAIRFTIYGKCDVCGTEHFSEVYGMIDFEGDLDYSRLEKIDPDKPLLYCDLDEEDADILALTPEKVKMHCSDDDGVYCEHLVRNYVEYTR